MACDKGNVEVVDKLLEMKPDVHDVDKVRPAAVLSHFPLAGSSCSLSVSGEDTHDWKMTDQISGLEKRQQDGGLKSIAGGTTMAGLKL